jgi:hypothetical protein
MASMLTITLLRTVITHTLAGAYKRSGGKINSVDTEDTFLQNFSNHTQDCMVSQPRRQQSTHTPLLEPKISGIKILELD